MKDALKMILIAGVGYAIYRAIAKTGSAINSAANSAAQGIANAYVNATSGPAPTPQGNVILPDGSMFPTSQLTGMGLAWQGQNLTFSGNDGNVYSLSPSDSNGNYSATVF